jgi:hypothetical protein
MFSSQERDMFVPIDQESPHAVAVVRRKVLFGGVALAATTLMPAALLAQALRVPGVVAKTGGDKPTYLPEPGSNDPVAHSIAENLFWNEQLMEHAVFFGMLMPGAALAGPRAQAEGFRRTFAALLARSRSGANPRTYRNFNSEVLSQVRRFIDFKRRMQAEQQGGRLKSLVWPTFFDHTAREAEYFSGRLTRLSAGNTAVDRSAALSFWSLIMGEHADFISHLLDPAEQTLIAKADDASRAFHKMHDQPPASASPAIKAVDDIIDFKTAAEQGIKAGKIKSIIDPALADHVRREALKAADELQRVA